MDKEPKKRLQILADAWEDKAEQARASFPIKTLTTLPKMPGITPQTARFLQMKALFYLIWHDKNKVFLRRFFKKPLTYALSLLRSYCKKTPFQRKGDFFFYGVKNEEEFLRKASQEDAQFLLGFSYCHKPLECPSGRFTSECQNDSQSPICQQCFIGKCSLLASHTKATIVYIPTIHYIGEKIFELVQKHPDRPLYFLITACEMTLKMFGDWGNMVNAKGIGVRLDGRICNTMPAFHYSERGVKPGLTVVLEETQEKILDLLMKLS